MSDAFLGRNPAVPYQGKLTSFGPSGANSDRPRAFSLANYAGTQTLLDRDYPLADNVPQIASLAVPAGWTVTLYAEDDFAGDATRYTSNVPVIAGRICSVKVSAPPER